MAPLFVNPSSFPSCFSLFFFFFLFFRFFIFYNFLFFYISFPVIFQLDERSNDRKNEHDRREKIEEDERGRQRGGGERRKNRRYAGLSSDIVPLNGFVR